MKTNEIENLAATNIQKCYKSFAVRKVIKTQRQLFERIDMEIAKTHSISLLETKKKVLMDEIFALMSYLE